MRNVAVFITVSCLTGVIAAVGCGTKSSTPVTGGSSSSSSQSSSGTGGGGGAGGSGAGGGTTVTLDCTIPAMPPSMGTCVSFTSDAGVELDAGLDDAGFAATTTCNPITNEGCIGTDVCGPDQGSNFYCQPAGSTPNVAVCQDCTALGTTCAIGGFCGPGMGPLGSNVGVCLIQ
jgi:hypothetical protein